MNLETRILVLNVPYMDFIVHLKKHDACWAYTSWGANDHYTVSIMTEEFGKTIDIWPDEYGQKVRIGIYPWKEFDKKKELIAWLRKEAKEAR